MNAERVIFGTEQEYGMFLPDRCDQFGYRGYSDGEADQVVAAARLFLKYASRDNGRMPKLNLKELTTEYDLPPVMLKDLYKPTLDNCRVDWEDVLRVIGGSGQMLENGARFYVDAGHPEYSTPECRSAYDLLVAEKAGETIVNQARRLAEHSLGERIVIYKDNCDRHGNSYAAHENYLLRSRELFLALVIAPGFDSVHQSGRSDRRYDPDDLPQAHLAWLNYIVTRQIWAGAGKAVSDLSGEPGYQLSQRAEFFSQIASYSTMNDRGIINTRDVPHTHTTGLSRLHVIIGDANLCEVAVFLKVGVTALFLKMLENGFLDEAPTFIAARLERPVAANLAIARDLAFHQKYALGDRAVSVLEIQEECLRVLERFCETRYAPDKVESQVLRYYREVLRRLREEEREKLFGWLDHVTKFELIRRCKIDSKQAFKLDVGYHDIDPETGLYQKLLANGAIHRLASDEDVERAVHQPPVDTRAWLRGRTIAKFPGLFGGWNVLIPHDDCYGVKLRLDDPAGGTKERCEASLDQSRTFEDLVKNMEEANGND
jgi:proteasome accessory factor A